MIELKVEYVECTEYRHLEAQECSCNNIKIIPAVGLPGSLLKHCKVVSLHTNGNTVADCISLTVLKDIGRSKLRAVGHDYVRGDSPGYGRATASSGCLPD